jgi:uncharacterized membrane protein YwaF
MVNNLNSNWNKNSKTVTLLHGVYTLNKISGIARINTFFDNINFLAFILPDVASSFPAVVMFEFFVTFTFAGLSLTFHVEYDQRTWRQKNDLRICSCWILHKIFYIIFSYVQCLLCIHTKATYINAMQ